MRRVVQLKENRTGFTLIELLVVIGILAVLVAAVVVVLNPAQLLAQARDAQRMSDLDTLSRALALYTTTDRFSLGPVNTGMDQATPTIFVSVPTTQAMQTSSIGYIFQQDSSTTNTAIDGTGWVPVNFTQILSGSPLATLPVDPINTADPTNPLNRYYYSYVFNRAFSTWELQARLESTKYQSKMASDGGDDDAVYEVGNNLATVFGGPTYGRNDFKGSQDFTPGWGPVWYPGDNNAPTPNVGIAPDGTMTADLIANDGIGGSIYQAGVSTYANGTVFTVSAWMRSDTPGTLVVFTSHVGGGWGTSKMFTLTSSWARYYQTFTMTAANSPIPYIEYGPTYTGQAVQPFYIWGAQLAPGNTLEPYARTTTSSAQL